MNDERGGGAVKAHVVAYGPARARAWAGALLLLLVPAAALHGQALEPTEELVVAVGNSAVVTHPAILDRVSIGNPDVADAVVVSSRELVVNGKVAGTTTLLIWDQAGQRTIYTVRVGADAATLQREFQRQFPDEEIEVTAMGNMVILNGRVRDPQVARRAVTLAHALGDVQIMDNIAVPDRGQILLQVRFAEVSRSAMKELGAHFMRVDPFNVRGDDEGALGPTAQFGGSFLGGTGPDRTFSDAVNLFLFHDASNVSAFIRALQTRGLFRSLAEPNLLAMPAESASFLAGGEFPFPVLQSGAQQQGVTIQFKEFGIRLNFVPDITNSGAIRLRVAPEVSSLDFASGLQVAGFNIPALLSRRAETVIELRDGQTFAIAGLLDNTMTETLSKVPILGDIPILGQLFRSKEMRQNRTELLVLVTPRIVHPLDEAPQLPTGEPETWRWDRYLRDPPDARRERGD